VHGGRGDYVAAAADHIESVAALLSGGECVRFINARNVTPP
jgi:hypothetical protein